MKYEIKKIAVNEYNRDGSKVYKYGFEFKTWRELVRDLSRRDKYARDIFYGRGSDIFRNEEMIGNVEDFYDIKKPIAQVTLIEFSYNEL